MGQLGRDNGHILYVARALDCCIEDRINATSGTMEFLTLDNNYIIKAIIRWILWGQNCPYPSSK